MTTSSQTQCQVLLAEALQRYETRNIKSLEYHNAALESLPGGNTRTLLHVSPFPIVMVRGEGSKLIDLDGHEYCDFVGELTAGLFGHSEPKIKASMSNVLANIGLSLGATNIYEKQYSELLCARFNLESLRFSNSGTEANLHCIAAARKYTGKRKIVVFRGGYHGSLLSFSLGAAPNNLSEAFEKNAGDIAAVLVEGMQGSGGAIPANKDFLRAIREHSRAANALLILDEVMTSRLYGGGIASTFDHDLTPDMKTFGKYLGGGMPFGAFGGRREIMAVYDPRMQGSLAHSGTFQNNTLMLNAGYTGLSEVYTHEVAEAFHKRGDALRARLLEVVQGTRFTVTGLGTLMCIHVTTNGLSRDQIQCKDDWTMVEDGDLKRLFWLEMLEAGNWFHPRASMALNLALTAADMDRFVGTVRDFCKRHQDMIRN
ncbi:glutamate-1-semialdehyde 2,1-aminomutase [Colletotrichum kahawae]|uniref:Glutamate-1-semialdehyde 2,1-aminomutase n=1 Tax=Colletotrichum kahawae TaxID=34407 RepID=A0AAD9YF40_COLKA|nr:glutamate-1-semialdehyde 2,1-aminomutase [Colletotrichum kahawae]